jgi:hypothetical protein
VGRLYVYAAIVAAALCALAWGTHRVYRAGAEGVRVEWAQRDAQAAESARLLARDRTRINQGIDHATTARQAAAARTADADRAAVGQLRDALAASSRDTGDAAAAGCADERRAVSVLAGLVSEGAGLLAEGAERGDGLATQAAGLREYVVSVCQLPVEGSR